MSEQTPENLSEREPSMEDILASIRKIIADDGPSDTPSTPRLVVSEPKAPSPAVEPEPFDLSGTMDVDIDDGSTQDLLDMVEFDLTDDMGSSVERIDMQALAPYPDEMPASEMPVAEMPATEPSRPMDILDLTELLELDSGDEDGLTDDAGQDFAPNLEAQRDPKTDPTINNESFDTLSGLLPDSYGDDDLDALLNNLIADELGGEEDVPVSTTHDPQMQRVPVDDHDEILDIFDAEDLTVPTSPMVTGQSAVSQDDDIDLVKSLMADLTEDNDHIENDEDIDALLLDTIIDDEDDEMAGISAISDAEIAPQALAAPIQNEVGFDELSDLIADLQADTREAQARAQNVQSAPVLDMSAKAVSGQSPENQNDVTGIEPLATAIAVAPAVHDDDDVDGIFDLDSSAGDSQDEFDALIDEIVFDDESGADKAVIPARGADDADEMTVKNDATSPEPVESQYENNNDKQEDAMSAPTGRGAIASRDTYEDSSSAFASLGKVVEEKAVFAERGPRIGDLVQEALKPMLQEWLDANLKTIVDRAVAKEIKRISGGK